jgi:hypothetical protein
MPCSLKLSTSMPPANSLAISREHNHMAARRMGRSGGFLSWDWLRLAFHRAATHEASRTTAQTA